MVPEEAELLRQAKEGGDGRSALGFAFAAFRR